MGSILPWDGACDESTGFSPGYGDHAHAGLEAGWGTYLNVDHRGEMSAIGGLMRYAPVD